MSYSIKVFLWEFCTHPMRFLFLMLLTLNRSILKWEHYNLIPVVLINFSSEIEFNLNFMTFFFALRISSKNDVLDTHTLSTDPISSFSKFKKKEYICWLYHYSYSSISDWIFNRIFHCISMNCTEGIIVF